MKEYRQLIDIRFADIDAYHHVNNAVYLSYMEHTRVKLMLRKFSAHAQTDIQFVVSEATCKYIKPIRLDDQLEVVARFRLKGRLRLNIEFRFVTPDDSVLYAIGNTMMACIDKSTGRPRPIPEELIEQLQIEAPGE